MGKSAQKKKNEKLLNQVLQEKKKKRNHNLNKTVIGQSQID